jgi:hypothetical protein
MSRWRVNYNSHSSSQEAQSCIAQLEGISIEGMLEQDLAEYSRLLKVLKVLAVRLSKLDPELFRLNSWENFSSWFKEASNQIAHFSQNRNIAHLQSANANIDEIVNVIRPLDAGLTVEEFKSIADANHVFQQKMVEELQRVRARGKETEAQLDSLSAAIADGKSRLEENNQVIQQQKTRLDQSIAEFQRQFSDAQERRSNDFADTTKGNSTGFAQQLRQFEAEFKEVSEQRRKEYDAFFELARNQSNAHSDFLKGRETEVNKIFGAIGTTAFAGNFKTTADNEASSANQWRWIALVLMTAMIGVGAFAFYYSIGHETDWRVFAFRLGTVIVLAVPAVYAANESSKHRERERLNRKIHLELASIDAYLVLLPENQRNQIKGGLTERFFGIPLMKEKAEEVTQKDLFSVLTTVLNNLTKGK